MKKDRRLEQYEFGYKRHRQTDAERIRELEDEVAELKERIKHLTDPCAPRNGW